MNFEWEETTSRWHLPCMSTTAVLGVLTRNGLSTMYLLFLLVVSQSTAVLGVLTRNGLSTMYLLLLLVVSQSNTLTAESCQLQHSLTTFISVQIQQSEWAESQTTHNVSSSPPSGGTGGEVCRFRLHLVTVYIDCRKASSYHHLFTYLFTRCSRRKWVSDVLYSWDAVWSRTWFRRTAVGWVVACVDWKCSSGNASVPPVERGVEAAQSTVERPRSAAQRRSTLRLRLLRATTAGSGKARWRSCRAEEQRENQWTDFEVDSCDWQSRRMSSDEVDYTHTHTHTHTQSSRSRVHSFIHPFIFVWKQVDRPQLYIDKKMS